MVKYHVTLTSKLNSIKENLSLLESIYIIFKPVGK